MVAADDDFMWVRETAQPVHGGLDFAGAAIVAEVAGVDEEVAIGNVGVFESVGVGDADDADGTGVRGWEVRRAAEVVEELMERVDESC